MSPFFYLTKIVSISLVGCSFLCVNAQKLSNKPVRELEIGAFMGFLGDSNTGFPSHGLQRNLIVTVGEIPSNLNYKKPKTGIAFGFSDLRNKNALGYVYSIAPFAEWPVFASKTSKLDVSVAMGASYATKVFNTKSNVLNKGVSTRINWMYNTTLFYEMFKSKTSAGRLGLGYLHMSNGHIKKPNRGYNSIVLGFSAVFSRVKQMPYKTYLKPLGSKTKGFYTMYLGIGQNAFSDYFNTKKEIYTVSISVGKLFKNRVKLSFGANYHFYEHYYDYIINDETLVRVQEKHLKENPVLNASSFGLFGAGEILLGRFGVELRLGLTIAKPFYKIDWKLNEGYTYFSNGEEIIVQGELNNYFKIKHKVYGRMGLKYYIIPSFDKKHTIYMGAFINSNLGQADFNEFAIGYEHNFKL